MIHDDILYVHHTKNGREGQPPYIESADSEQQPAHRVAKTLDVLIASVLTVANIEAQRQTAGLSATFTSAMSALISVNGIVVHLLAWSAVPSSVMTHARHTITVDVPANMRLQSHRWQPVYVREGA